MGISRVLPIVFSIILLAALGSFQDAEAGIFQGVFWTGEGGDSSWNNPNNWEDPNTDGNRLPVCTDFIEIFGDDVVVNLNIDFTICGGHLQVDDGATLQIDSGKNTNQ